MAPRPAAARRGGLVALLSAVPLLLLPVAGYNLAAALMEAGDVGGFHRLSEPAMRLQMASGAVLEAGLGDLIVLAGLVCLFVELLKSTGSRGAVIVNHGLSILLFIVCLVEFLLLPAFATPTFFLLMAMVLLDVVAGFIMTIAAARRDVDLTGG